jgi:hypothetical protein
MGYEGPGGEPSTRAAEQRDLRTGMTPSQRINTIAEGQRRSRGLGNARGASPAPLTAQRALEMDYESYYQFTQTPAGRAMLGDDGFR